MSVTVKCQYALRAMFELARRWGTGMVRIPEIAEAQDIPPRFLQNILNQLRQGGLVDSRRGMGGGFRLARPPHAISVEEIIRFIDGEVYAIECEKTSPARQCKLKGSCVFMAVWQEAKQALESVYRTKTLQDLLESEKSGIRDFVI